MKSQEYDPKKDLGYQKGDPSVTHFQYLEDLATGAWYGQVLFASIEVGIFDLLKEDGMGLDELVKKGRFDRDTLSRFLSVLKRLGLLVQHGNIWSNTLLSNRYLTKGSPSYLGDFLLYRKFIQGSWEKLTNRLLPGFKTSIGSDEYSQRNFNYVRAMDQLLRLKAKEIFEVTQGIEFLPPILDVGGGAGALARYFIKQKSGEVYLLELEEVLEAAKKIYPDPKDWEGIHLISKDFRTLDADTLPKFNVIILSNFLHAYGRDEAKELLHKAASMVSKDGFLLIHDYFPDRNYRHPQKGSLYDINMLLNTYNGRCHSSNEIKSWLKENGINIFRERDLTDSSIILAGNNKHLIEFPEFEDLSQRWTIKARDIGFRDAYPIKPDEIVVGPWVRLKCKYGCKNYNKKLQCPPHTMTHKNTSELLSCYSRAILLEGAPPLREFHQRLLNLEKEAFLSGLTRAFAFGAGPCPICEACPEDGICRHPELARPSMEASGMDVYLTLKEIGIALTPLKEEDQFVRYFGLLLLD